MVYSGFRISGFLSLDVRNINMGENYMIGGVKTEAGRNRICPNTPFDQKIYWPALWPKQRKRTEKLPEDSPHLLIANKAGKKYDYRNFTERIFLPTLVDLHIIPEYRKGKLDENGIKNRRTAKTAPDAPLHSAHFCKHYWILLAWIRIFWPALSAILTPKPQTNTISISKAKN